MRVEKINGIKVKVFTKKDLVQKLGLSEDDSKIIMRYQKTFPELLQDDIEGFVIDARMLWEQLDRPYTRYADWIKKKVMKVEWIENTDFDTRSKIIDIANGGHKQVETHFFTIEMAKNICMMENTDKGMVSRKYFILMEKALRSMEEWTITREPQKEGYKEMCSHLQNKYNEEYNGNVPFYIYSREADMLNLALLGAKAKDIRKQLEVEDNQTREWLNVEVNKALSELQLINSGLIISDMIFEEREGIIRGLCKTKYVGLVSMVFQELDIE